MQVAENEGPSASGGMDRRASGALELSTVHRRYRARNRTDANLGAVTAVDRDGVVQRVGREDLEPRAERRFPGARHAGR